MLSESARMTTTREAGFRVQYPNSRERAVKVIALDPIAAKLLEPISREHWHGAAFFTSLNFAAAGAPGQSLEAWLEDVAGQTMNLIAAVSSSDFVVVITSSGEDARAVSLIADACKLHNKTLVALIVPRDGASDDDISASLKDLRPYARMLVVASGADYIEAMLTALRA
jgi:hypothetical protein